MIMLVATFAACLFAAADLCQLPRSERFNAWQRIYGNVSSAQARTNFYKNDAIVCSFSYLSHNKFSIRQGVRDTRSALRPLRTVSHLPFNNSHHTRVGVSWPVGSIDHAHHVKIEDQLSCQSCWAFTTTTVVEAALAQIGLHRQLSSQHLINCAVKLPGPYINAGCDGGYLGPTMMWAFDNGFVTSAVEPYSATEEPCEGHRPEVHVHNAEMFPVMVGSSRADLSNSRLENMVSRGPTEVVLHANDHLQFYDSSEVFLGSYCSSTDPVNHAVVVVGFGTTPEGIAYWKVANSWGSDWNNGGFFKIERGVDACGIETHEAVRPYGVTLTGHTNDHTVVTPHEHAHSHANIDNIGFFLVLLLLFTLLASFMY